MQSVTAKDLEKAKKPIQVYFDREMVMQINKRADSQNLPVAEYIRITVQKDLEGNVNKRVKKRNHKPFNWGVSIAPEDIDKIAYGI